MAKPDAEMFRDALRQALRNAEKNHKISVTVNAGDLHREVGDYPGNNHRMPTCCNVMKQEMRARDRILESPPSEYGPRLTIEYKLPR